MPGLRELLSRFRAAGAPGAPGAAGVPVDLRAGVTAELEPVFAALAETVAGCERRRADGAAEAQRCLDEARGRAAALLTQAKGAAPAVRAAAAARTRRLAEAELAAIEADSRATAEELTRRAEGRLPDLVNEVVERVRHDIATLGDGTRIGSAP